MLTHRAFPPGVIPTHRHFECLTEQVHRIFLPIICDKLIFHSWCCKKMASALDGVEGELYLTEMRSIGGLSGSPVFASSPVTNTYWLIGVIHGHHTLKEMETTLHTGMALVTPIMKLLEILEQSELIELRQMEEAARQASLEWSRIQNKKRMIT